nr:MAG TPA: hypothetical protein [Caudoviricetes sp.]
MDDCNTRVNIFLRLGSYPKGGWSPPAASTRPVTS